MPLPIAAIATAGTAAAMEYLRQRNQAAGAGTGPQVGKLVIGGTAVRASTAALLGNPAMSLVGPSPTQVPSPTGTAGIPAAIQRILGQGASTGPRAGGAGGAVGSAPQALLAQLTGASGAGAAAQLALLGGRRRYRRMNIANVKALRRAGRRLSGFVKLAKSMVQLEQRARIKKRRRR